MFECSDCGKAFPYGLAALRNHCYSTGHSPPTFACDTCPARFSNHNTRWAHMSDENHFGWECKFCDDIWPSEADLGDHYIDDHNWCESCDRYFDNTNNIRAHLNSRIHRGQNICCFFCPAQYTTATGMVHHLERGSCPNAPQLNRDQIYRMVRSRDPSGIISKKLIGWEGEANVTYEASSMTWNGYGYECYLCHKQFSSLHGLNQHLNSPAHQQQLYHCPNLSCRADFKTLAAIINHLESESCKLIRFEMVQQRVSDIFSSDRMITFA